MVSETSARPSGGRPLLPAVPAKMTSSILPPRRLLAPCSPSTHAIASTTLDLPEPLGPTTQVIPGSKRSVVDDANDLNPRRVRLFRCTEVSPRRLRCRRGRPRANLADLVRVRPRTTPGTGTPGKEKAPAEAGAGGSRGDGSGERGLRLLRNGVG